MLRNSRWWHSNLALFVFLPLMATAFTGAAYRWTRNVFNFPKEDVKFLLQIHQGSYFTFPGPVAWTGFNAISLLFLIVTGYTMMKGFWASSFVWRIPQSYREFHQKLSSFTILFVGISATTGVLYRWARNVFGFEKESVGWLLMVHEGGYLENLPVLYSGFVATGFLLMAFSGITMLPYIKNFFFKRRTQDKQQEDQDQPLL